jgi:hypothetical protein
MAKLKYVDMTKGGDGESRQAVDQRKTNHLQKKQ